MYTNKERMEEVDRLFEETKEVNGLCTPMVELKYFRLLDYPTLNLRF